MTSPIDLDEADRIGNAASVSPWNCTEYTGAAKHKCVGVFGASIMIASMQIERAKPDADFIAFARNNWSAFVDELRAARDRIRELEAEPKTAKWKQPTPQQALAECEQAAKLIDPEDYM